MIRNMVLTALLFGSLAFVGSTTGCSDSTGPNCSPETVELTAVFFTRTDSTGTYELEYGNSHQNMLARGGQCTIREVEGIITGGYPLERRTYSCVVCSEAYPE